MLMSCSHLYIFVLEDQTAFWIGAEKSHSTAIMARISILKRPLAEDGAAGNAHIKKFQRKTARGKVLRVIRERYLRDDIGCGCPRCAECRAHHERLYKTVQTSEGRKLHFLADKPLQGHPKVPEGARYYMVIDTNIVLHQMDLLEAVLKPPADAAGSKAKEIPAITSVIVLQTVLDEVRARSLPLFNRLQALIREPERNFWVYWNDFSE